VQQNDLAAEPFRKSQCELKSLFGHWGKIDWHENFFEIQNCWYQFYDLSGFHQLSFHLQRFSPVSERLAQQRLANRVHFLRRRAEVLFDWQPEHKIRPSP
jgi:hypothetical protein